MNRRDLRFITVVDPGDEDGDPVGTLTNTYIGKTADEVELRPGMKLSLSSQIAPDGYTIEIHEVDDE